MSIEYDTSERGAFDAASHSYNDLEDRLLIYSPEFDQPIDELLEKASTMQRGEPDTFGATPLDKMITSRQQEMLLAELRQYTYDVPMGVSMQLASYVHETFADRFRNRAQANNDNYTSSLLTRSAYEENPIAQEVIDRAELGFASPAELLIVQQLLGIRSVELACLTHPYGERIKPLLSEMRSAVGQSVITMGGEMINEPKAHFRAKEVILNDVSPEDWATVYSLSNAERLAIAEKYGGVCGLLMTRKREIGYMPNGSIIKERSSFILRLDDACPITSEEYSAMLEVPANKDWQDEVVKAGNLDTAAEVLLSMDAFDIAIPVASTIYAHNHEIANLVTKRFSGGQNPIHTMRQAAVAAAGMFDNREVSNLGGMLYVGPKGESGETTN